MIVSVKRNRGDETPSYFQAFQYDGDKTTTVAEILRELDDRVVLTDIDGNPAEPIKHECKCLKGLCGACAMVINNTPNLPCKVRIDPQKTKVLKLEPLWKLHVIADLCVERETPLLNERIEESLNRIIKELEDNTDCLGQMTDNTLKCIHCGLCLQVCPNFTGSVETFYGLQYALRIGNLLDGTAKVRKDLKATVKKEYWEHFSKFCSRDFACYNVCPLDNVPLKLISSLNRKL